MDGGSSGILVPAYLERSKALRPLVDVHLPHADADGAGRDDDHLVAILPELHGRLHHHRQDREMGLARLFVHDGTRPWTLLR